MTPLDLEIARAREILDAAVAEFDPVAIYAGFSGGYDSLVTTHLAMAHLPDCRPLHINTGIGVERTREFVRRVCRDRGWDLREEKTAIAYEDLVLGRLSGYLGGFPGPAMHGTMYNKLKERPIRAVMKEAKRGKSRRSCVMFLTGIRHDESRIRTGYQRVTSKVDSQVWVNPLYWATADHFRAYRGLHSLPANPVKDATGMSGECLCGAFASPGELDRVRVACPATADYLAGLERRVRAAGFPWGYGERPPGWFLDARRGQLFLGDWMGAARPDDAGPMCHSCEKYAAHDPDPEGTRP